MPCSPTKLPTQTRASPPELTSHFLPWTIASSRDTSLRHLKTQERARHSPALKRLRPYWGNTEKWRQYRVADAGGSRWEWPVLLLSPPQPICLIHPHLQMLPYAIPHSWSAPTPSLHSAHANSCCQVGFSPDEGSQPPPTSTYGS